MFSYAVSEDFKHVKQTFISVPLLFHQQQSLLSLREETVFKFQVEDITTVTSPLLSCNQPGGKRKGHLALFPYLRLSSLHSVRRPLCIFKETVLVYIHNCYSGRFCRGRSCSFEHMCFRCAFSMAEIKAEPKLHVLVVIVEHGLSALLLLSRMTNTLFFACIYSK